MKYFLASLLFLSTTVLVKAQDLQNKPQDNYTIYTFFFNTVPDRSPIPLIGFGNFARGNHNGLQLGFANVTRYNFNGVKMSFVNIVGENFNGANFGFANTTGGTFKGASFSFINTVGGNVNGANFGFVNTIGDSVVGSNIGFVNIVGKDNTGLDLNFVSVTKGDFKGAAIGFVNVGLQNTKGLQLGLVNTTSKELKGIQFGFVNIADTVSKGVPIGLLSIVKKGGYRALEVLVSELYVVNLAFKIGVPYFYSFIQGSYHYDYNKPFALGAGFGSLIPIAKRFYFSPEIGVLSSINNNNRNTTTLAANVRYSLSSRFQVAAGLSAVWLNGSNLNGERLYNPPFFSLFSKEINAHNRFLLGARVAVSFNFTKL